MREEVSSKKVPENRIFAVAKVISQGDSKKKITELLVLVPGDSEDFSDDDEVMPIPLKKKEHQEIIGQLPKEPLRDLVKRLLEGRDREAVRDAKNLEAFLKEKEGWREAVEKLSEEDVEYLREILQFSIQLGDLLLKKEKGLRSILRVPNGSVLALERVNKGKTDILTPGKVYELFDGDRSRSTTTDEVVRRLAEEAPELLEKIVLRLTRR
jgi:hypothetical protein